jgi:hypothetical protein
MDVNEMAEDIIRLMLLHVADAVGLKVILVLVGREVNAQHTWVFPAIPCYYLCPSLDISVRRWISRFKRSS